MYKILICELKLWDFTCAFKSYTIEIKKYVIYFKIMWYNGPHLKN